MGNHRKNIFWPLTHPNPNCTLCPNNEIDTWPHLLSTCPNPHIKKLRIARHNKAVHQIVHTLQSNKNTRFYTLTNAGNQNSKPQDITVPEWLLKCTCAPTPCTCMARLRPDILCIIGAPNDSQPPLNSTPSNTVQFIEFTYTAMTDSQP
jgi:hypothetical protein